MSDARGPAEMNIRPARAPFWSRISVVWLVPVLALAISLAVAWRSYSERGTLIEIGFQNASGIEAGQTQLRYRDVSVGMVEDVSFAPDLSTVRVLVRVENEILPYLDGDAQFWVVRPEVTTRGISGLGTVLSGVYIEGSWDTGTDAPQRSFAGLDTPPFLRPEDDGTTITLRARDGGQLAGGAPVLYRGIEVGRLGAPRLTEAGDVVEIEAFIDAPHDRRITTATRFWDASGFSVSLGSAGVRLDVGSLAALVEGGVVFETVFSGGDPIEPGETFDIFDNEQAARDNIFNSALAPEVRLSILFDGSVRGLTSGAPVMFRGVKVGSVDNLSAFVSETPAGRRIRLLTNISVQPTRLGLPDGVTEAETLAFLSENVALGLRARLATQNLLTSALMVELVEDAEVPAATIQTGATPYPQIPSAASDIADFAASAEGVLERINALPVEELMGAAISLMTSIDRVAASEGTQALPGEALGLIGDARALIGSEALQTAPAELAAILAETNALLAELRQGGAVARLLAALDDAAAVAANVNAASGDLPALVEGLNALTAKANALPLDVLVTEATAVVERSGALIGSDAAAAIPASVAAALTEINAVLATLREGGAADRLVAALGSAQAAAANVNTASGDLPALVEGLNTLTAKANTLALEELVSATTTLMTSAEGLAGSAAGLIDSDPVAAIPPALATALAEVNAVLATLGEAGAAADLVAALQSARVVAANAQTASAGLPQLLADVNALAARANALPLDTLVAEANGLLATADALIGSADAAAIPAALAGSLDELRTFLVAVREGGAVESTNAALASARLAADAVAEAVATLPALVARLDTVLAGAGDAIGLYGAQSQFNYQTIATLQEIRRAAEALTSLSRTIERNPNSILLGR